MLFTFSMIEDVAGSVICRACYPGGREVPLAPDSVLVLPAELAPQGSHERFIRLVYITPQPEQTLVLSIIFSLPLLERSNSNLSLCLLACSATFATAARTTAASSLLGGHFVSANGKMIGHVRLLTGN